MFRFVDRYGGGVQFTLPKVSSTISRMLYYSDGDSVDLEGMELKSGYYADLEGNEEIRIRNGHFEAVPVA
jgi:hypothetical protein